VSVRMGEVAVDSRCAFAYASESVSRGREASVAIERAHIECVGVFTDRKLLPKSFADLASLDAAIAVDLTNSSERMQDFVFSTRR
jgi:hypothetical protein